MRAKNLLWISLVAILLTSTVMTGTVMSPSSARMYVDPPEVKSTTEYPTGSTFTVNVSVADVADIYGWEFALDFNPALLQVQFDSETNPMSFIDFWNGTGTKTTFWTTEKPVLSSPPELVLVDDEFMVRNVHYTIDYTQGIITFMPFATPGMGSEVKAIYYVLKTVTIYHVTEGPFLKGLGSEPIFVSKVYNDEGTVKALGTFEPPYPTTGASGTGALATIEFLVIGTGVTALDLQYTQLLTVVGEPPNQVLEPVAHATEDGVFDNRPGILPPNAIFTVVHPNMTAPVQRVPITFDASLSNDADDGGWIVSYYWDFGDGTNATGLIVDHTFANIGTYTVSLTVVDNDGLSDTASESITVVLWIEGGTFPDLVGWMAKPETSRLNEAPGVRGLNLRSLLGNPTEDYYEVYVEFTIISKDEAKVLGILTTDTTILEPGEYKTELTTYINLTETRWEAYSGSPMWVPTYNHWFWKKYTGFARCYYRPAGSDGDFTMGFVHDGFQFKVDPMEHDIAVLEVTTNAINGSVPEGDVLEIYVNITNYGPDWEPFNITVTYKGYTTPKEPIEVRPSTLLANETRIETFTWNTSGMTPEPYLIRATLSKLTYEDETGNNTLACLIVVEE